jgi:hypothetical protein
MENFPHFFSFFHFSFPSFYFLLSFSFLLLTYNNQGGSTDRAAARAPSCSPPMASSMLPPSHAPSSFRLSPLSNEHSHGRPWKLQLRPWLPSHGEPHTDSFFVMRWPKPMHMTSLLQSPPSIVSEMNSNLQILRDSVFQLNSDFISNSNLNPSGLLPHPYISLGAPPPCIPMPPPPPLKTKL